MNFAPLDRNNPLILDRQKFSVVCPYCGLCNNHIITYEKTKRYCHSCGRIFDEHTFLQKCKPSPYSWR